MAAIADTLRHDLKQPEFSEGYAESFLDAFIATQLKVLREQNTWTQAQLAERMGKKQTVISRSENINYSSWNINTLKEYARAFRLRLRVSFETYGSLIDEVTNFSKENLRRTPRERDPELGDIPEALVEKAVPISASTAPPDDEQLDRKPIAARAIDTANPRRMQGGEELSLCKPEPTGALSVTQSIQPGKPPGSARSAAGAYAA